eukprot:TRINITY_DN261_c1_g1_i1.p1 TRINITY_DN261_c1_g1~~TRINITY_DN261_c1_g1_i1.p1  ORF type:complete len:554 (+),score=164.61 TRINITY_DN261_c1_g1_i1:96-1664(+)
MPNYKKFCKDRSTFWGADYLAKRDRNISLGWSQFDKKPEGVQVAWSGGFSVGTSEDWQERESEQPAFHGVLEADTPLFGKVYATAQHDSVRDTRLKVLAHPFADRTALGAEHQLLVGLGLYTRPVFGAQHERVGEFSCGVQYTCDIADHGTLVHRSTMRRESGQADYRPLFPAGGHPQTPLSPLSRISRVPRSTFSELVFGHTSGGLRVVGSVPSPGGGSDGDGEASLRTSPRAAARMLSGAPFPILDGHVLTRVRGLTPGELKDPSPPEGDNKLWRKMETPQDLLRALAAAPGDHVLAEWAPRTSTRIWSHASNTQAVVRCPGVPSLSAGGTLSSFGRKVTKYELGVQYALPPIGGFKGGFLGLYGKGKSLPLRLSSASFEAFSPVVKVRGRPVRCGAAVGCNIRNGALRRSLKDTHIGVSVGDAAGEETRDRRFGWLKWLGGNAKLSASGEFECAVHLSLPHSVELPSRLRCALSVYTDLTKPGEPAKFGLSAYTGGEHGDRHELIEEMTEMVTAKKPEA